MKKKYVKDRMITLMLGTGLTICGLTMALQNVSLPSIGGAIGTADGDTWATWTPEGGLVTVPGHEEDMAQWNADTAKLQSGDYVMTTDGQILSKSDISTTPVNPSAPDSNKEFDDIVNLPVGDEYDNACKELKEKDEAQFDKFLDYQQDKALACEHDFVEISRGEATCTEHGFISYECSKCHTLQNEDIEPLGHQYEVVEEVAATCTEDGYTKLVCSICGDEKIENKVPATGHTEVTEETPAGLFKNGSCVIKCSTCGEILTNEIIPQIIPMWAAIVGGILIVGIAVFVILSSKKKA